MIEWLTAEYDVGRALIVGLVLFTSSLVVRVAGFGAAITAMPIISPMLGLNVAAPLMNLSGATNFTTLIIQKWKEFTFSDMWRVALMNVLFTPVGIWIVAWVDESILRLILGIVCAGYALVRLGNIPPPALHNRNWGWLYGIFSGVFTGAFSVGGIPAVLYAETQQWEPERFRINMFSFFALISGANLLTRYFAGQITLDVVLLWLTSIPFMFFGLWVGEWLTQFINKERFQKLVLVMLVILGGRLVYSAF